MEVTPDSVRMRKRELGRLERKRGGKLSRFSFRSW